MFSRVYMCEKCNKNVTLHEAKWLAKPYSAAMAVFCDPCAEIYNKSRLSTK